MRSRISFLIVTLAVVGASLALFAQSKTQSFALDSVGAMKLINVKAEASTYKGRKAVRLLETETVGDAHAITLIPGTDFADGTIELDVVGNLTPSADPSFRGFVGLVFRAAADGSKYENFYIRPTNGRAELQIRRNHATQYTSYPDFPWHKLRKENPGEYESYADMIAGEWTHLHIEVAGAKARMYVNGADQPQLVVNDLKHGASQRGLVGLWIGAGTDGYFSNLKITHGTPAFAKEQTK